MPRRAPPALLLVAALAGPALAGCVEPPFGARDESRGLPPENGAPGPRTEEPPPANATRHVGADCLALRVTADPPVLRPRQISTITATLTNGCDASITVRGTNGCTPRALSAGVLWNDTLWSLGRGGSALDARLCTGAMQPSIGIGPGDSLSDSWMWNGTFNRQHCSGREPCHELLRAPAGEHLVTSSLRHEFRVNGHATVRVESAPDAA